MRAANSRTLRTSPSLPRPPHTAPTASTVPSSLLSPVFLGLGVSTPGLFLFNRLVDVFFIVDLGMQFFIPFRQSPQKGSRWVYSSRAIAKHYLRRAFALDLVAAIPYDFFMLGGQLSGDIGPASRVLRALKLVKLSRVGGPLHRWVSRLNFDLSVLELLKFLAITLLAAHWLACTWGYVGHAFHENTPIDLETWYVQERRSQSWIQKGQLTDATPFELYGVSLYVAFSNILGGPTDISPANYIEYYTQAMMMAIGSSLWAYIIAAGCGIVQTLNPIADEQYVAIILTRPRHLSRRPSQPPAPSRPSMHDGARVAERYVPGPAGCLSTSASCRALLCASSHPALPQPANDWPAAIFRAGAQHLGRLGRPAAHLLQRNGCHAPLRGQLGGAHECDDGPAARRGRQGTRVYVCMRASAMTAQLRGEAAKVLAEALPYR